MDQRIIGDRKEKNKLEKLVEQAKKDPAVQRAVEGKSSAKPPVVEKPVEKKEELPVAPPVPVAKPNRKLTHKVVEQEMMKRYRRRIDKWKNEGYDTAALEKAMDSNKNYRAVVREIDAFRRKVYRLKDSEVDLLLFTNQGIDDLVEKVRADIKDVNKVEGIRKYLGQLKTYLTERIHNPNLKPPEYTL